jgi:3-methyladenine DNA glycosylase AlkD
MIFASLALDTNMNYFIEEIRQLLIRNADQKTKETGQNFFKEKVMLYGVKTAVVSKIGKEYFKAIKDKNKAEIYSLCEELWQSGYMEDSFIACNWSFLIKYDYQPQDFAVFEKWVEKYVSNWASCDTLCNHTIGTFVEKYPQYASDLIKWAKSPNRWMRRASAVSLIIPARKGKFLTDIFEIADSLLLDQDDLVQKGYGWMLKAASQAHQKEVFDYVMKNKAVMPRTAFRYAIEKMPKELIEKAMERNDISPKKQSFTLV